MLNSGGREIVWRNHAAVQFYEQHGFFGSSTMPWNGFKTYLPPDALQELEQTLVSCFATDEPILHTITAQAPGHHAYKTGVVLTAVFGAMTKGVVVAHFRPLHRVLGKQQ